MTRRRWVWAAWAFGVVAVLGLVVGMVVRLDVTGYFRDPGHARVVWGWVERASWLAGLVGVVVAVVAGRVARQSLQPVSVPMGVGELVGGDKPGMVSVGVSAEPPGGGRLVRGRDALVAELSRAWGWRARREHRVRVLHGLGGCGKTTVAWLLARRATEQGLRVWWVSAATSTELHAQLRQFAIAAGAPAVAVDQAWAGLDSAPGVLWRALDALAGRWLLVIDNADDPAVLAAPGKAVAEGTGWLRHPGTGRGLVVVTSREGSPARWGSWCRLHPVSVLNIPEAAQVLRDHAGPAAGTSQEAAALAARLGGLPLALRLAGAYLAHTSTMPVALTRPGDITSFAAYQAALDAGRLDILRPAQPPTEEQARQLIERTWELSLDLLDHRGIRQARTLLRLLSCLADAPIPYQLLDPPTLAANCLFDAGLDGPQLWQLLRALADLGLVDLPTAISHTSTSAVVRIHPLVRDASRHYLALQHTGYLALAAALLHNTINSDAAGLPEDPAMWPVWQMVAPHAFHVLRAVATMDAPANEIVQHAGSAAILCARYLHARGRYLQAEAEYRDLLTIQRRVLGDEHPHILATRYNLTRVLHAQGDYPQAEAEYRDLLTIQRRLLSDEHLDILATRYNLANVLYDRGDYAQAEAEYRDLLTIGRRVLGDEHLDTLTIRHELARVLHDRGDYAQAEAEYRDVLTIRRRVLGDEHPDTLTTRHALMLLDRGDYAQAEYRDLLTIQRRVLGDEHPHTLTTRHNLARVLHERGRYVQAEAEYCDVLTIRRRVLGDEHPKTLATRHNLALALLARGQYAQAEAEYCDVLTIQRRVLSDEHPHTLTTRYNFASMLYEQGDYAQAEAEYRDVLTIQRRVLGDEHPDTMTTHRALDLLRKTP